MKKSILALLFAGMLFFTACGGGKAESETSQEEATSGVVVTEGIPMVVQMFGQEATHLKMRMYVTTDGKEETVDVTLAMRGKEYVYFMEFEGAQVRMISKDDTLYIVSDNEKLAMNVSALGIPVTGYSAVPTFTGGMYNAGGTGEVRGETLPYYEYNVDNASVRYYVSKDMIKYITFTQGEEIMVMEILELSTNVDDSLFTIPADYTIIESMTDFMNMAE